MRADAFGYDAMVSEIKNTDLATIIYTSGTSGNPKGVMLTHANFLHNVRAITPLLWIDPDKAERTVSILPSWHVYERCFEYCLGAGAMSILYSSIRTLANDLKNEKPHLVASVPRIWESIYDKLLDKNSKPLMFFLKTAELRLMALNRVKGHVISMHKCTAFCRLPYLLALPFLFILTLPARLLLGKLRRAMGGKLRASFSGGGSLPPAVDLFFNAAGVRLVNAYGMTETSPGTITRRLNRNTLGSIGIPLPETEVKIIKPDGTEAGFSEKGILHVRGPQVMQGYYKNQDATDEILSKDGWLNTGDLAMRSFSGDYVMTGRAKSTIVLLGGENAEPEPIEEKLRESHLIEHAVVLGQDKKTLSAVIALKEEQIKRLAEKWRISMDELWHKSEDVITHSKLVTEIQKEIKRLINRKTGFKPFEKIGHFVIIKKKFMVGDELTQTLKVKRKHVEKKYKHLLK